MVFTGAAKSNFSGSPSGTSFAFVFVVPGLGSACNGMAVVESDVLTAVLWAQKPVAQLQKHFHFQHNVLKRLCSSLGSCRGKGSLGSRWRWWIPMAVVIVGVIWTALLVTVERWPTPAKELFQLDVVWGPLWGPHLGPDVKFLCITGAWAWAVNVRLFLWKWGCS